MRRMYILYCAIFLSFLLGTHQEYVALFREGSTTPVHVFSRRIGELSVPKQKALQEGIPVENAAALVEILRAYLS